MNPNDLKRLQVRLQKWRARHADVESLRAAYQRQVLKFTVSSMALENEPVSPERLMELLRQPVR